MNDPTVYRSRDPEVVQAWIDAMDAIGVYAKATQAVLEAHGAGGYRTYRNSSGWSPGRFAGLAIPEGEEPPAGWRRSSAPYAVPDKRTRAGREVAAALEAVKHPGGPLLKLTGMLPDAESGEGFTSPGVRLLEDRTAVYVFWSFNPEGRQSFLGGRDAAIDFSLWGRVKLSGYYAEVERADEARAVAS